MEVIGLKYLLCGVIPCCRPIVGSAKVTKYEVSPPMPVLEVVLHDFPKSLYHGEIKQVVVEISNKGGQAMKNLWVKSNDSSSWRFGTQNEIDREIFPNGNTEEGVLEYHGNGLTDDSIFVFTGSKEKGGILLNPNETNLIPLWIRGGSVGVQSCKLLFLYQSKNGESILRNFKSTNTLTVLPSLSIRSSIRRLNLPPDETLMRLDICNNSQTTLSLKQITSLGPKWMIDEIIENGRLDLSNLGSGKAVTLYFRIRRDPEIDDIESTPEIATTSRIEKLLQMGEIFNAKKNEDNWFKVKNIVMVNNTYNRIPKAMSIVVRVHLLAY